jgi:hypothetical protein
MSTQPIRAAADEWDLLTTALNRYGIKHVAPRVRARRAIPVGEDLFYRLASARSVRLQESIVLLLLTHPDLAALARAAIARLAGDVRTRAMRRYVAACALQRLWWTRLSTDLGPRPAIAPAYLDELGLPPLALDFGRATLVALSNREEEIYGYDAWAGYRSLMDLFLGELIDKSWGKSRAQLR